MNIKRKTTTIATYVAVGLLLAWTLGPLVWMFISSIAPSQTLLDRTSPWFPAHPTFERYYSIPIAPLMVYHGTVISSPGAVFRHSILNSLAVTSVTTALSLVVGGVAAYAFARLDFRMKKPMLYLAMFLQLVPPIALVIPFYFMIRAAGMIDRLSTLIILNMSFVLAYVIWVLNGYFKTIPRELESAARIDGCSRFGAFIRVILPNAAPGFVAVGALSFLLCWDEFLFALIFTNSLQSKTIPVAISEFSTQFGIDYGMMMTGGVLTTLIPLVLALVFQRYIISGLTTGALKA